ncbi:MAG: outer membrane protein transport protein [Kiritimatiellae bacterium]|nr:outer membrane protein transport protein [Kiritimatiellia bacterium]
MKRGHTQWQIIATIAIMTAITQLSLADGYRNPPASASALGRIGGKIVHIDDASAASVNPANLTGIDKTEVMASLTFGYASRSYEMPCCGISERTEDPWAYLPAIFAATPLGDEGEYVLGIGLTVPYGRFTDWGSDVVFAAASPYYAEQRVIELNPSIATKLGEKVSIAVGVSIYQSDLKFKQAYPWSMLTMNPADPMGKARFDGDGWGYGANAAITWDIDDNNAVALTYRSPFTIDYEGDFDITQLPPAVAMMGATSSSDFETEIDYPTQIALGYGIKVSKNVHVEFNVEWIEASSNAELPIDIDNNTALLPASVIPQDWDDNWTYGIGANWLFTENWTARAGYMYLETPTSTATTLPVAAEDDQSVVSIGLGYDDETHSFDIAYAVGIFDTLTVDDNAVPPVNGNYDFSSHLVSVAYGYRF